MKRSTSRAHKNVLGKAIYFQEFAETSQFRHVLVMICCPLSTRACSNIIA